MYRRPDYALWVRPPPRMKPAAKQKRRAEARRFRLLWIASDHWSRRSTLCCDWLASASADTAIDWRVDSAWLLAASSLVSASVRVGEAGCRTVVRFFRKSC